MTVTLSPDRYCGFLIPEKLEADIERSTLGQYGPKAGMPMRVGDVLDRRAGMELTASGEQTAGTVLDVKVQTAGNIGRAGVIWKESQDDYYRGGHFPNALLGFEPVGWDDLVNEANPHAITFANDDQIVVYQARSGVSTWAVSLRRYQSGANAYSAVDTIVSGLDASYHPYPALLLLPDTCDRTASPILLCAFWRVDTDNQAANVDVWASRDNGETWAVWATAVLSQPVDLSTGTTLGRLRLGRPQGQIAIFGHLTTTGGELIRQWASADLLSTATEIGDLEDAGWPDVAEIDGAVYLGYLQIYSTSAVTPLIQPVQSAFVLAEALDATDPAVAARNFLMDLTDAATVTGTPALFTFATWAMTATPEGQILAVLMRPYNGRRGYAVLWDPATSDQRLGSSASRAWWYDGQNPSTEYPIQLCASAWRGQLRVYATMASSSGTFDDRLTRLDLGGSSTLTLPRVKTSGGDGNQAAWSFTSVPTALASAYGFTMHGAGSNSVTTATGWETFTTSASQRYATITFSASDEQQAWRLWKVKRVSGGGTTREIACSLRIGGVGYGAEAELRFSATTILLRDIGGAANLVTVNADVAGGVLVLLAIRGPAAAGGGMVSAWYLELDRPEDQVWIPITLGDGLTDDLGAGGTANLASHGQPATGTATSRWVTLGGSSGDDLGSADLASGFVNPDDLRGLPLALRGVFLGQGVSVGASGGAARPGDAWLITADADQPIRNLAPAGDPDSTDEVRGGLATSSAEPAQRWQAAAGNSAGYVLLRVPEDENRYAPPVLAVHVEGLDGADPAVVLHDKDAATYTNLGTLDNTHPGLKFVRSSALSRSIRVDLTSGSTGALYFRENELVGDYLDPGSSVVWKIVANSAGYWGNDGYGPPVIVQVEHVENTDPTSGTLILRRARATFIAAIPVGTEWTAAGLYWGSATTTYGETPSATVLAIGPVPLLLDAGDWGQEDTHEDPATIYTSRSGLRRGQKVKTRARRIRRLPVAKFLTEGALYAPGVIAPRVHQLYTSASYYLSGTRGDEAAKLVGGWLRAGGSETPVVWLPRIQPGVTTQTLLGRDAGFYGRVTSPPSFTAATALDTGSVRWDDLSGQTLTLEEEI